MTRIPLLDPKAPVTGSTVTVGEMRALKAWYRRRKLGREIAMDVMVLLSVGGLVSLVLACFG